MRKLLIAIFGLLYFTIGEAQVVTKSYGKIAVAITKEKKSKKIYCKVEILSPFSGGDTAWVQKTEEQINQALLTYKKIKKGTYHVLAQFVIDKEGSLSDIKPLSNVGYGMEDAVLRALKKRPFWKPALQGEGRVIKPYRTSSVKPNDSN